MRWKRVKKTAQWAVFSISVERVSARRYFAQRNGTPGAQSFRCISPQREPPFRTCAARIRTWASPPGVGDPRTPLGWAMEPQRWIPVTVHTGLEPVRSDQERACHVQTVLLRRQNSQDFSRRAELRVARTPPTWAAGA